MFPLEVSTKYQSCDIKRLCIRMEIWLVYFSKSSLCVSVDLIVMKHDKLRETTKKLQLTRRLNLDHIS